MDEALYEARRGGGRALVDLIRHLSHLTVWGWLYLVLCIGSAVGLWFVLDKLIPVYIRKIARQSFPFFTWIAIPQYKLSLSGGLFLVLFCFLGYFGLGDDDVTFFTVMGVVFLFFLLINQRAQHSFMLNQNEFYISRLALFGKYKKIRLQNASYNENAEKQIITIFDGDKKYCRIRMDLFSYPAQKRIRSMLKTITPDAN